MNSNQPVDPTELTEAELVSEVPADAIPIEQQPEPEVEAQAESPVDEAPVEEVVEPDLEALAESEQVVEETGPGGISEEKPVEEYETPVIVPSAPEPLAGPNGVGEGKPEPDPAITPEAPIPAPVKVVATRRLPKANPNGPITTVKQALETVGPVTLKPTDTGYAFHVILVENGPKGFKVDSLISTASHEVIADIRKMLQVKSTQVNVGKVVHMKRGAKGRKVYVTSIAEDAINESGIREMDSFDSAYMLSSILGFGYNAVSMELRKASLKSPPESEAVVRGFTICYEDDLPGMKSA